jgi:hypothetical protein
MTFSPAASGNDAVIVGVASTHNDTVIELYTTLAPEGNGAPWCVSCLAINALHETSSRLDTSDPPEACHGFDLVCWAPVQVAVKAYVWGVGGGGDARGSLAQLAMRCDTAGFTTLGSTGTAVRPACSPVDSVCS